MSLIQSARMNGHDPYAYLKDVLTQRASEIGQLLPHQWVAGRVAQGGLSGRLDMDENSTHRSITPSEFDAMTREFDEALVWMEEQLKQKHLA